MAEEKNLCSSFQEEHVIRITKNEERSKSNTHQLNEMKPVIELLHTMNINIEVMAKEMVHQGKNNEAIIETQIQMQGELDDIKENMETKEVVKDIINRLTKVEKLGGKIAIKAWIFVAGLLASGVVGYLFAQVK